MYCYDTAEGVWIWFDADYTKPEPSVGWTGGWEITTIAYEFFDEDDKRSGFVDDKNSLKELDKKWLTSSAIRDMEKIAKEGI